jgi:hypothetical protein
MQARNALSAKMAECYIMIPNDAGVKERHNFMSAINLEVTFEKNKTEVAILGRMNKGHKSTSSTITGSAEFHLNTSVWRELAYKFQQTGEDIYFDIQVENEDPTSAAGRQTMIFLDCNIDGGILAKFDAGGETLDEDMDFTFEDFKMPETFKLLAGMQ